MWKVERKSQVSQREARSKIDRAFMDGKKRGFKSKMVGQLAVLVTKQVIGAEGKGAYGGLGSNEP